MDNQDPLLKLRPTVNPYFFSASAVSRRLKWDLQLESWRSRRILKSYLNLHEGKKAVILCNGPSLNSVDFDSLSGSVFVFGLNKINLLFERSSFRPDAIAAVNPLVIEQNSDFYNHTSIPLFLDNFGYLKKLVAARNNVAFLHSTDSQKFARDCSVSVNQGFTVTYVALQLAFHMGFDRVALVGCDHNFAEKGPSNKTVVAGEKDLSHFDPRYFSGGNKWQLPDLFESEVSYGRAKKVYDAFGRKIFNCTVGGHLEIFERMSLPEFLSL